uniref:DA-P36 family member n=1 Tax=Rhipicephalus appendiculatus TaxID=34631 RepID=A0A131Z4L9_RHIAP
MKLAITVGLISLIVVSREGMCEMLNLSEVAEQYIKKRYPGRVASWNLTGGYRLKDEHPVEGKVQEFEYQNECERTNSSPTSKCFDSYTFYFSKSILTPFDLKANILVFYNGTPQTFSSNLSGATTITWKPKTVKNPMKYTNKTLQATCNFSAVVDLKGWLAFTLSYTRGDEAQRDAIPIGSMYDSTKGLRKHGSDGLRYTVEGTYWHARTCRPKGNKSNAKKNRTNQTRPPRK